MCLQKVIIIQIDYPPKIYRARINTIYATPMFRNYCYYNHVPQECNNLLYLMPQIHLFKLMFTVRLIKNALIRFEKAFVIFSGADVRMFQKICHIRHGLRDDPHGILCDAENAVVCCFSCFHTYTCDIEMSSTDNETMRLRSQVS